VALVYKTLMLTADQDLASPSKTKAEAHGGGNDQSDFG